MSVCLPCSQLLNSQKHKKRVRELKGHAKGEKRIKRNGCATLFPDTAGEQRKRKSDHARACTTHGSVKQQWKIIQTQSKRKIMPTEAQNTMTQDRKELRTAQQATEQQSEASGYLLVAQPIVRGRGRARKRHLHHSLLLHLQREQPPTLAASADPVCRNRSNDVQVGVRKH